MYNVKDFGAKGDGKTNDTASIQQAFDAIPQFRAPQVDRGGVLFFPTGVYLLDKQLSLSGKPIGIVGEGKAHTILKWMSQPAGIVFNGSGVASNDITVFAIAHISLTTSVSGSGGTALRLDWPVMNANPQKKTIIQHVEVRGWDQYTANHENYWDSGIWISNPGGLDIAHTDILGKAGTASWGIRCDSPEKSGAIRHLLSNIYVLGFEKGISWTGPNEGVYLNNFEIVNCRVGFAAQAIAGEGSPVYHLSNGHLDCRSGGATFEWINEVKLHNIAFYHTPKSPLDEPRLPGNLVSIAHCKRFTIAGCSFYGHTPPRPDLDAQNGIIVEDSFHGLIVANHFDAIRDLPLYIKGSFNDIHAFGNRPYYVNGAFGVLPSRFDE